ncbi:S1 family peptidase [Dyadobacter sp. NIV53]|uniref:S1 family peptidase n=1 Tax=Dyadobacter sp. NIV53 TaxID=2861765 RepID=UPI001C8864C5|nr:S1 family peptidase [Dyadobacter sp. NIV53]
MPKDTYIPRNEVVDINKEFNKVRKQAEEELMKLPGVIAVGVGLKEVKGEIQRQPCFKVKVDRKKAKSELGANDIIPDEIYGFKTDVTEIETVQAQGADSSKYRPIISGSQIESSGMAAYGTLGCFAKRNSDNKIVILSNWHVIVDNPDAIDGDRVGQPTHSGCCSCCSTNEIGKVSDGRFKVGNMDAAIALLSGQDTDAIPEDRFLNEVIDIGSVSGSAIPLALETVFKRGRTTLLTKGQITDDNAVNSTTYNTYNNLVITRSGQFEISPSAPFTDFTLKGDSGSVSVNEHNEVVLLNYSGSDTTHKSYGTNIKSIETTLGITILNSGFHTSVAGKEGVLLRSASESNHLEALAQMQAELSGSKEGMRILELFRQHRSEILDLVRHKREVMVAWNRYQGPAYLAHIAKNIRNENKPVPEQIKDITMQSLLLKMAAVLQRNGSPELAGSVSENYLKVMNILTAGRSPQEWRAYLHQLDTMKNA